MIRFVTHCWSKDNFQYASFLKIQLDSIRQAANHTPGLDIVVCFSLNDERTLLVVEEYLPKLGSALIPLALPNGSLFRRSIGRNRAVSLPSVAAKPALYWFTDVDYFFRPDIAPCVARAWDSVNKKPVLFYPKSCHIQPTHLEGDELARDGQKIPDVRNWPQHNHTRAIGGIQIVSGDWARKNGYVPEGKWAQPRTDGKAFGDFRDDIAFRRIVGNSGTALEIPGVYRCRHTCKTY